MQRPRPFYRRLWRDLRNHILGIRGGKDLWEAVSAWNASVKLVARLKRSVLTIDEGVENELSVLLDQIVDVTKDTAVDRQSWCRKPPFAPTHHMVGQVADSWLLCGGSIE